VSSGNPLVRIVDFVYMLLPYLFFIPTLNFVGILPSQPLSYLFR
jgi:hypothetical protein